MKTFATVFCSGLLSATVFAASPVHHYAFDVTAVLDSVGSADGKAFGGASIFSGMLALNGTNGYVEFSENLIPSANFSVALFAEELSPSSDRAELLSQGYMFGPGFYLGYYPPARSLRVGDEWQTTGLKFPSDRSMHHYAVTTDAVESRLYIDAVCVATNGPLQSVTQGTFTRLGRQYEPWGEFFHGNIDEVWIFEGALSAAEVAQLASVKPLPPKVAIEVSQVRICWPSQKNVSYQLQYRSASSTSEWVDDGPPIAGDGTTVCVTDQVAGPLRLYRVVASPATSAQAP